MMPLPLAIGTETPWGIVSAVGVVGGFFLERYYWITGFGGCVSTMPACVVEDVMHYGVTQ